MGKVASAFRKPIRDFNLESRAFKVISKDKPTPAPMHPSDRLDQERLVRDFSNEFEESLKKHEKLDINLKSVFVTSFDPQPKPPPKSSSAQRPLPLDKSQTTESDFGFREPIKVPYGKITLRSALKAISRHQNNPTTDTIQVLATEYKLPEETIQKIVNYYKIFAVYMPEKKSQANFVGPKPKKYTIVTKKSDLRLINEPPKKDET